MVFQIVLLFFFQLFYILPCYILHKIALCPRCFNHLNCFNPQSHFYITYIMKLSCFIFNLYSIVVIHYTFSSLYPADDCHAYGKYFIFCISMAFMPLSLCCGFVVRIKVLLNLMYFVGVKYTPKNYCELEGFNRFNHLSYTDSFYAFSIS